MNSNLKAPAIRFIVFFLIFSSSCQASSMVTVGNKTNNQQRSTLCTVEEKSIFTCLTGRKIASLCIKESQSDPIIHYRYGTNNELELVYPDTQANSSGKFKLSSTPYPGGGANRVRFVNGEYSYFIYEVTMTKADVDGRSFPTFMSGITVRKDGKNIASLYCDNEDAGISSTAFDIFDEEHFDRNIDMNESTSPGR